MKTYLIKGNELEPYLPNKYVEVVLKTDLDIIEENRIYQMDCMDLMKKIPDKYFDLILTDPPYGITGEKWDKIPSGQYFDEMFRVSKNQIIFGADYFQLPKCGGWIVWNKRPFLQRINPLEFIWTSFKIYDEMLEYTIAGNCEGFHGEKLKPNYSKKKNCHRAQKPINVCKWLLNKFAKKGDKIFDPFAGSGSILVACKELGFNYIGCEINPDYIKMVNKRLNFTTVGNFTPARVVELGLNGSSADSPKDLAEKPNPIV